MRGRSWMAALTVAAGLWSWWSSGLLADEPKAKTKAETRAKPTYVVKLDLAIAGLGKKGCDVEIKPGNGGCKFTPVIRHIEMKGAALIEFKDVETQSADRDCTFAITVKEPGQAEKTVRRGLRLKEPGAPGQSLSCYISSPSKLAKAEQEAATRR